MRNYKLQVAGIVASVGLFLSTAGIFATPAYAAASLSTDGPAVAIKSYTNNDDADTVPGPIASVGSQIIWTYVVANTGNVALSNIAVTDNMKNVTPAYVGGDVNGNGQLDTDELWTYQATGNAVASQYTNFGTVTATTADQTTVTAEDVSHYYGSKPGVAIQNYTNGIEVNADNTPFIATGSAVAWTYEVANAGNIALSNIVVTDNNAGVTPAYISGDDNNNGQLDVNEIWTYQANGVAVAGEYSNLASVAGISVDQKVVTNNDVSNYFGTTSGIAIKSYTNGDDADSENGPSLVAGDTVTWTYTIANTGNVALNTIVVTDNGFGVSPSYLGGDVNNNGLLDVNESWTYHAIGTAVDGQYANIGAVKATSPEQKVVNAEDASHYVATTPVQPEPVVVEEPVVEEPVVVAEPVQTEEPVQVEVEQSVQTEVLTQTVELTQTEEATQTVEATVSTEPVDQSEVAIQIDETKTIVETPVQTQVLSFLPSVSGQK